MLQFFFKIAYMKTILRVIVSLTKGYCYNTFFRKLPVCIIDEYIFNMNFLTGGRRSAMPRRVSITSTLQLCLFMHSSKIHTITRRKRTSKCVDERIEERMTEPIQRGHLREQQPPLTALQEPDFHPLPLRQIIISGEHISDNNNIMICSPEMALQGREIG